MRLSHLALATLLTMMTTAYAQPLVPRIAGEWWGVSHLPPDLGELGTGNEEPVDFSVWQAGDGTWQLWSCIRRTKAGRDQEGGTGRLFYRWEGPTLTSKDWKPMGIAMQSDTSLGETPGGLQAPHVVRVGDTWHMFYGDWVGICHATSKDGKTFERVIQPNGKTAMFIEDPELSKQELVNTRDIMMLPVKGLWYGYYTAQPHRQGVVYCRTTKDFKTWSESTAVSFGGQAGTSRGSSECPHVVHPTDKDFYLFKTQTYGNYESGEERKRGAPQTSVYHSTDPLMFGINQDDEHFVGHLAVAAPEFIYYDGQWYVAALNEGALNGIRIARLEWARP